MAALFVIDVDQHKKSPKTTQKTWFGSLGRGDLKVVNVEGDEYWWAGIAYNSSQDLDVDVVKSVFGDSDENDDDALDKLPLFFRSSFDSDTGVVASAVTLDSRLADNTNNENKLRETHNKNKEYFENLRRCYDLEENVPFERTHSEQTFKTTKLFESKSRGMSEPFRKKRAVAKSFSDEATRKRILFRKGQQGQKVHPTTNKALVKQPTSLEVTLNASSFFAKAEDDDMKVEEEALPQHRRHRRSKRRTRLGRLGDWSTAFCLHQDLYERIIEEDLEKYLEDMVL